MGVLLQLRSTAFDCLEDIRQNPQRPITVNTPDAASRAGSLVPPWVFLKTSKNILLQKHLHAVLRGAHLLSLETNISTSPSRASSPGCRRPGWTAGARSQPGMEGEDSATSGSSSSAHFRDRGSLLCVSGRLLGRVPGVPDTGMILTPCC